MSGEPSIGQVFLAALAGDLATGLGVLPFFFVRTLAPRWRSMSFAAAGGMMVSAAVFSLSEQGAGRGQAWQTILGMGVGSWFFWWSSRLVKKQKWSFGSLDSRNSSRSVLMVVMMFVHSIPEGVAVGVGFATGEIEFGLLLATAIAVHNIPEGIAIALPLRAAGLSNWKCVGFAILSSVPQPLAAVPAFLLVGLFQRLLPAAMGFAGGAMIFLVVAELIPDSLEDGSREISAWAFMAGLILMLIVTSALGLFHS